ncbi:hypothetical protein INR49_023676 [Caranx melampygus]|nr:hypothetical protein INR49_023676 [Caranx melampygus]
MGCDVSRHQPALLPPPPPPPPSRLPPSCVRRCPVCPPARPVSAPPLGALPRSHPGPEASASSFTTPAPRTPPSCPFHPVRGCGLQFESLAELIVHIEDNHIGESGQRGTELGG